MQAKFNAESKSVANLPKFFSVTASAGAYRNAESIKRVTVTGPYRIDRISIVSTVGSPIHNEYVLYAQKTLVRYSKISPNIVSNKVDDLDCTVIVGMGRIDGVDRQRWLDPSEASMADPSVSRLTWTDSLPADAVVIL